MGKDLGWTLWLCAPPDHPILEILRKLIVDLSAHFPAGHDAAPRFEPHITLTNNVSENLDPGEVIKNVDLTGLTQGTFDIALSDTVVFEDFFFRKAVVPIVKHSLLLEFAARCRSTFVMNNDYKEVEIWSKNDFFPHLSLVYSNQWPLPATTKELIQSSLDDALRGLDFRGWAGGEIRLVNCNGSPESWKTLASKSIP